MGLFDILGSRAKSAPGGVGGSIASSGFLDAYRSRRAPTKFDLLYAYKNIAYACASINAMAVASTPIRAFVVTKRGQKGPRFWETAAVEESTLRRFKSDATLTTKLAGATDVRELINHPIQDLLSTVNDFMNRFDLFEWTTLSQEIDGNAYWYPARDEGGEGKPLEIYPLEAHRVAIIPDRSNGKIIDHYEYSAGVGKTFYRPDEIIHFKYLGLADPYLFGMSPLRASFEQANVSDKLIAYEEAVLDNRARPDMLISPKDTIGPKEAERLERKFQKRFQGGGSGGILIGESGLDYKALVFPPSDLAALEIRKASKEELANAFGVPISMLRTEDVNRANAEAGEYRHAKGAVLPRCRRMQEQLNARLCPMFDDRIFLAFDNPVPEDEVARRETVRVNLQTGKTTINEERAKDGLPPVLGGEEPLVMGNYIPLSFARKLAEAQAKKPPKQPKPAGDANA